MTKSLVSATSSSGLSEECPVHGDTCPFADKLEVLQQEIKQLNTQVRIDELTGLYNYRHFLQSIDLEMERSRRSGHPVSLVIMDLDHFKSFNDRWGHEAGNQALVHIARILRNSLRRLDIPCRYGGEEFAIILPGTPLHAAIKLADRLRLRIAESVLHLDNQALTVTASFGVDCMKSTERIDVPGFVARADHWLYEAKKVGRNSVRHAPDRPETHVSKDERDLLLGD